MPVMPDDRHAGKTKCQGSSQCYQVPKQSFIKKNLCSRRGVWGHVVGGVAGLSHDADARGWELIVDGFNCSVPCSCSFHIDAY